MNPTFCQQNLICPIHSAQREYLIHICVSPNCQEQPLLCVLCKQQTHRNHETKSFGNFSQMVQTMKYDESIIGFVRSQRDKLKQKKTQYVQQTIEIIRMVQSSIMENQNKVFTLFEETEKKYELLLEKYLQFELDLFKMPASMPSDQLCNNVIRQKQMYFDKKMLHLKTQEQINGAAKDTRRQFKGFAKLLSETILNRLKEFNQQTKNINSPNNQKNIQLKDLLHNNKKFVRACKSKSRLSSKKSEQRLDQKSLVKIPNPRTEVINPQNPDDQTQRNEFSVNQSFIRIPTNEPKSTRTSGRPRSASRPQNRFKEEIRPKQLKYTLNHHMRLARLPPR